MKRWNENRNVLRSDSTSEFYRWLLLLSFIYICFMAFLYDMFSLVQIYSIAFSGKSKMLIMEALQRSIVILHCWFVFWYSLCLCYLFVASKKWSFVMLERSKLLFTPWQSVWWPFRPSMTSWLGCSTIIYFLEGVARTSIPLPLFYTPLVW